jgi:transcriptional regulator with XRE-family HTH domain
LAIRLLLVVRVPGVVGSAGPFLCPPAARDALSQEELRDLSGVSRATIADLEAGNRGAQPRTIRKLAEALGVEPDDLYGELQAPKAEAPPSQQPPLNGFVVEERRPSILADAITAAAEAWLAALTNPNITIQKRFGIRDAAIELFEHINARVVRTWESLPIETRRDIVRAMAALNEVPEESYRLMPEDTLQDSSDVRRAERRRKIREWTDRISA